MRTAEKEEEKDENVPLSGCRYISGGHAMRNVSLRGWVMLASYFIGALSSEIHLASCPRCRMSLV